jgi:hypothetical protein
MTTPQAPVARDARFVTRVLGAIVDLELIGTMRPEWDVECIEETPAAVPDHSSDSQELLIETRSPSAKPSPFVKAESSGHKANELLGAAHVISQSASTSATLASNGCAGRVNEYSTSRFRTCMPAFSHPPICLHYAKNGA